MTVESIHRHRYAICCCLFCCLFVCFLSFLGFLLFVCLFVFAAECRVDCRQFVSHGCLGFLVLALSSLHKPVRAAASHALTRFKVHLRESRFREKAQVRGFQ